MFARFIECVQKYMKILEKPLELQLILMSFQLLGYRDD